MKNFHYFVMVSLSVIVCSCQQTAFERLDSETELNFFVANYEQIPLGAVTKVADATSLRHLAMTVYDASTNKLVGEAQIQDAGQADYGQFKCKLPYGRYQFVFLGYESTKSIHLDDPSHISWDNNAVTNTFVYSSQIDVNGSTQLSQTITLQRAVGVFSLVINGNVPSTLNSFKVEIEGCSNSYNALTRCGNDNDKRSYVFQGHANHATTDVFTVNTYAFLPSSPLTTTITVSALDKNGQVIRERMFRDVPMKINQLTKYTGDFFAADSSNGDFKLQLDADPNTWEESVFTY